MTILRYILLSIESWQTLIAGFLALLGAIITVKIINKQINESNNIEYLHRKRNERSAKIILPAELRRINLYAIRCMTTLSPYISEPYRYPVLGAGIEPPPIPDSLFAPLQEWSRHADDDTVKAIADLIILITDASEWFSICLRQIRDHSIRPDNFPVHRLMVNFTEIIIRSEDLLQQVRNQPSHNKVHLEQRFFEQLCNVGAETHEKIRKAVHTAVIGLNSPHE